MKLEVQCNELKQIRLPKTLRLYNSFCLIDRLIVYSLLLLLRISFSYEDAIIAA